MLKKVVQMKKKEKIVVLCYKHQLNQLFKIRNTETNNDSRRKIFVLEFSDFVIIIFSTNKS